MFSSQSIFRRPVSCLLILLTASVLSACDQEAKQEHKPAPQKPVNATSMPLKTSTWTPIIPSYGSFESAESVTISVDFSAAVKAVHFQEGQAIDEGQVLIELDKTKRQLRVTQAEANVATARARLEKSRSTYERYRSLLESRAVSQEAYKGSEAEFASAKAGLQEAVAAEALYQRELTESTIISPVQGKVVNRQVEPGQTVLPGNPLAVVQVVDTLRVVTYVTEKEVNSLRIGDQAPLTTPGVPGREYQGRIELIGSSADPRTGNYTVKLTVPNDDGLLRDGMSARINLRGAERANMLQIPADAVADRNRRKVVYIWQDGKAIEIEPVFGLAQDDLLPVLSGLKAGDQLLLSPLDLIADGSDVTLLEEQP